MPQPPDAELKPLIKQFARTVGLDLTDDRVEPDLAAFKTHLAAIERIRSVDLPLEAEPFVTLKR
jgi:hypothetical protein